MIERHNLGEETERKEEGKEEKKEGKMEEDNEIRVRGGGERKQQQTSIEKRKR